MRTRPPARRRPRELREETGVQTVAADLILIKVYDTPDRDPRGRYVSVAYRADVPDMTPPTGGDDAAEARWFCTTALPALAFDHDAIIKDALTGRLSDALASYHANRTST